MDGLGDAVNRFNQEEPEPGESQAEENTEQETGDGDGKGHSFHIHKHKNGKHHLTVHGDDGQLVHHSEHETLEDAAEEMKNHGESSVD